MARKTRAQTSVELLVILAISLAVLALLISFTSDQLTSLQKDNAVRTAQRSMQTLIEAVNRTYAQGPGTISLIEVTWPPGVSADTATLSGRSITMRVYGTDVTGTAVPLVTGSLSTTPGTQNVKIIAHDANVQLGTSMLSANVYTVYLPMAQDTNQTSRITLTNASTSPATLSMSLPWTYSLVGATLSPTSGTIPAGGTFNFDLRASALASALGNYVGAISVSGTYPSSVEGLSIPVNIEVFPNSNSLLTALPSSLSFRIYSTDSNTQSFQLCNNSSTTMSALSFTPSTGNAGAWVQGISTIPSLAANTCTSVNVTVAPSNGVPGDYTGSLLVQDYTGANSLVIPLAVTVAGESSLFAWDWTTATRTTTQIQGITLRNTGGQDVTMTGITMSNWWACDANHSNLTTISLNSSTVFTGAVFDGNLADINDTLLGAGLTWSSNTLAFSSTINDDNEQFVASVHFSDGSTYVSSVYGTGCSADVTSPSAVKNLAAVPGPVPGSVKLTWSYPGDDSLRGSPVSAVLKYSIRGTTGYTNDLTAGATFAAANSFPLTVMGPAGSAGSLIVTDLNIGYTYNFAVTFKDEVDNNDGISNQAISRTWNKIQYTLSQFPFPVANVIVGDGIPNGGFVHSIETPNYLAGDVNILLVTNLVPTTADGDIIIRIADDTNSSNSWVAELMYITSHLSRLNVWCHNNLTSVAPYYIPSGPADFTTTPNTPVGDVRLDDPSFITGGWNYGGSHAIFPSTTTIYVDYFRGFSDMNIVADNGDANSATDINIGVDVSRTTGPAPLAVFFDANSTTKLGIAHPFLDLEYNWNFGDDNSDVWTTNGKTRNTSKGPLAAHVFKTPGTYTVNLSVNDANNSTKSSSYSIIVTDPDTQWSGTNTVCLSTSGNFTGCPSGALNVTTLTYDDNYVATGRRILYRKGERFTQQVAHSWAYYINSNGPGMISSYGSGARPIIDLNGSHAFYIFPSKRDWRITGLDFNNPGMAYIGYNTLISDNVFENVAPDGWTSTIGLDQSDGNVQYNFVIDNNIGPFTYDEVYLENNYSIQSPNRIAVIGNTFNEDPSMGLPTPVFTNGGNFIVSNNNIKNSYSDALISFEDNSSPYTTNFVQISDNNLWDYYDDTIRMGVNNTCVKCHDIIIERNIFDTNNSFGLTPPKGIALNGDVNFGVIRNNTFKHMSKILSVSGGIMDTWTLSNNSIYFDYNTAVNTIGGIVYTGNGGGFKSLKFQNNISVFPNPPTIDRHTYFSIYNTPRTEITETNNIWYDVNFQINGYSEYVFDFNGTRYRLQDWNALTCVNGTQCGRSSLMINPQFINAAGGSFGLQVGSPAIDSGATITNVLSDFNWVSRLTDNNWDRGAFEVG